MNMYTNGHGHTIKLVDNGLCLSILFLIFMRWKVSSYIKWEIKLPWNSDILVSIYNEFNAQGMWLDSNWQ